MIIQLAVTAAFVVNAFAQPSGASRRIDDTRRMINNDNWRELMKVDREHPGSAPANTADAGRAVLLKQMRDDFKGLQEVNNKMMAEAWAQEGVDYVRTSTMIAEINTRAARLKTTLALPEPDKAAKRNFHFVISSAKEFKSALLRMDHSIMSFVTNPIFQNKSIVEIDLASRASEDLEDVITLSAGLKKVASNLKGSGADH